MKVIDVFSTINYAEPQRALTSVILNGAAVLRGANETINTALSIAATMSNPRVGSRYDLALAEGDTIVSLLGTFDAQGALSQSLDFSTLPYSSYDIVLLEDNTILESWAVLTWQAPVSLTSVAINGDSVQAGAAVFLLDITQAEAVLSSPLPDKTYRLCLAQNGAIVKNLGAFVGTQMNAVVSMQGEAYGQYSIVLVEDLDILVTWAQITYAAPASLTQVSLNNSPVESGAQLTLTSLTAAAATMYSPEPGVTYALALAKAGSVVKTLGTFNGTQLNAQVDMTGTAYDVFDIVLLADAAIAATWARLTYQAPVSLDSVSINGDSVQAGSSLFLLDITQASAVLSSPFPGKTYALALAQSGSIVKTLGTFVGSQLNAQVSMQGESYGQYDLVFIEDSAILSTWAQLTYAAPASLTQVSLNGSAVATGAVVTLADVTTAAATMYSPEPGVTYALALAKNGSVIKTLGTFNGTQLNAQVDMQGTAYDVFDIVLLANSTITATWATLKYELSIGGISLMGATTFKSVDTSYLDVVPHNPGYSVPLTNMIATLTIDGQPADVDAYLRASANKDTMKVAIQVIAIPDATRNYALSVDAIDANGDSYNASAPLTLQAIPVSSFAISGDASISEAGTKQYTIIDIMPADYNIGIQSLTAQVTQPSTGSVSVLPTGTTGAQLTINTMPDATESITLTINARLTNGMTVSAIKSVELEVREDVDYVDLGLPSGLKWTTMNLGANAPEESGLYFSWGNVEGHAAGSGYNFNSSTYNSTPGGGISGLNQHESFSQAYDAAHAILGDDWRMPTDAEFKELYDNTDSEWITLNGVAGRKFMKKSDHSVFIFFPAAGYYNGTSLNSSGSRGCYWSSSWFDSSSGYRLYFNSGDVDPQNSGNRYYGFSVRAVQ